MSLRRYFRRRAWDEERTRELAAHLQHEIDDNCERGMLPEEARRQACIRLGNPTSIREEIWEMNSMTWLENLMRDLRYALRQLERSPGFAAIAVLVLALGIGANTAIFSVIDAVLLKPLRFPHPNQLVEIKNGPGFPLTGPNFLDMQRQNHDFQSMALYTFTGGMNLTGTGRPEYVAVVNTQANFFQVLGVAPLLGRTFAAGEDQPGRNNVAVLSYGLWRTAFAARSGIVGHTVELDGRQYSVIGIMPRSFAFPADAELWTPQDMSANGLGSRGSHQYLAIGRLRPGVTPKEGLADLQVVQARLDKEYPGNDQGLQAWLAPLHDWLVGQSAREGLLIALGAVGLVLLIACGNVANLLLARAAARQKEMAVRAALGASRGRLVRQLLTESLLLSLAGGVAGLGLAAAGIRALMAMKSAVPQPNPIGIHWAVLAFTVALAILTAMVFGLAPAWYQSRAHASDELKGGAGATVSAGRHRRWLSDALVVGEAAVSVALLIAAGLLLRSFVTLETVQIGARKTGVLTASVELPSARYKNPAQIAAFGRQWLDRVRALPGVQSAALTSKLPLEGGENGTITLYGQPANSNDSNSNAWVEMHEITSGYLRTFQIPLLAGRELNAQDAADELRVDSTTAAWQAAGVDPGAPKYQAQTDTMVVACDINQRMARMFWPGKNPIGQKFSYWGAHGPWWQVVGVVGNTRQWGLAMTPRPEEFQAWDGSLAGPILVLHASVPPQTLVAPVRYALAQVDPDLVLYDALTMQQIIGRLTVSQRFMSWLIGIFAALALVLAAAGIYGVMSYLVTQRAREIGIRMALGANRRSVLANIVGHGMKLTALGILLGLLGALAAGRVLASLLFEVKATDWRSFAAAAVVLAVAALAACWLPGRRAAAVDPSRALRQE